MHCCGYALTRRDWMGTIARTSLASMFSAACATTRSDPSAAPSLVAAERLLRENVSIDVHTHAGPNGITNRTVRPSDALVTGMRAGRIAILCLSDVPDGPILGRNAQGVLTVTRTPAPGELWNGHLNRLAWT